MSDKFARDFAARHPHPGDDPVARLRHVVEIFGATPDNEGYAVLATSGMYVDNMATTTGLSFGDLAKLDLLIAEKDREIERLREYSETTQHHQQRHAEAVRTLARVKGSVTQVAVFAETKGNELFNSHNAEVARPLWDIAKDLRAALSGGEPR